MQEEDIELESLEQEREEKKDSCIEEAVSGNNDKEHPSNPMVPFIPSALLVAGSIPSGGKTFTKKLC